MIIAKLNGGLGNQMFRYALGRSLAKKNDTELKLDISEFKTYTLRKYELENFNIKENFAKLDEIAKLANKKSTCFVERTIRKLLKAPRKSSSTHILESRFTYDPEIKKLGDNIYLDGHWQSWRYFDDISAILRREFTLKKPPSIKNNKLAKQIGETESVSIHIRRGDYVTDLRTRKYHGICEMEYFSRCIKYIVKRIDSPNFFVFSDEPEWAISNLQLDYTTTIIDHNSSECGCTDMSLMSLCKHNIIANSSFSWWAAWLNKNPNKMVLSPARWFNKAEHDTSDLIPISWKRI